MNFVKVKLMFATLLSVTLGTAGCANAQQISRASLQSNQVLLEATQTATKPMTADGTTSLNTVSESTSPVAGNRIGTAPAAQVARASHHQAVASALNTLAPAPLITLGQGEDLVNMVEHASGVVLLDFYADWCGPCRTQSGILHEMEHTARQNNASIIKVNVDQHRQLASAFNVSRLPTLILVKNGQIIERQTGVANHQRVATLLSK